MTTWFILKRKICYHKEMEIKRPSPKQVVPPDAKKTYAGVIYTAYQWQQERFDGSFVTYERLKRPDSVVIIPITEDGKIVISREQQPGTDWYMTLPCGGIDLGEEPLAAAKRELLEETGYASDDFNFWFARQVESRVDCAIFAFVARNCKKVAKPEPEVGERVQTSLVSFEEFLHLVTADDFQNINIAPKLLAATLDISKMVELKKLFGLV